MPREGQGRRCWSSRDGEGSVLKKALGLHDTPSCLEAGTGGARLTGSLPPSPSPSPSRAPPPHPHRKEETSSRQTAPSPGYLPGHSLLPRLAHDPSSPSSQTFSTPLDSPEQRSGPTIAAEGAQSGRMPSWRARPCSMRGLASVLVLLLATLEASVREMTPHCSPHLPHWSKGSQRSGRDPLTSLLTSPRGCRRPRRRRRSRAPPA